MNILTNQNVESSNLAKDSGEIYCKIDGTKNDRLKKNKNHKKFYQPPLILVTNFANLFATLNSKWC